MRAIDKLDRLGVDGVTLLLGEGRKDESGDFTKGAGLNDKQSKLIIDYIRAQRFTPLEYVGSEAAAAVDGDRGTGDEGGFIAGEEQHRAGDLIR